MSEYIVGVDNTGAVSVHPAKCAWVLPTDFSMVAAKFCTGPSTDMHMKPHNVCLVLCYLSTRARINMSTLQQQSLTNRCWLLISGDGGNLHLVAWQQTSDAVLELAVLDGVYERVDTAVDLQQYDGKLIVPSPVVDRVKDQVHDNRNLDWRHARNEPTAYHQWRDDGVSSGCAHRARTDSRSRLNKHKDHLTL